MKKLFLLLVLLFFYVTRSLCCEICGCGVGNFYMGLLPNFKTKFIGLRYSYLDYHTQLNNDPGQFSNDFYKTLEFWSGWNFGNRWQAMVFIPFRFNTKISDDGFKTTSGPGDITLLANYSILHTRRPSQSNRSVEQQIWLGGGIKLPTGAYRIDLTDPNVNIGDANSQAGTGSTDLLINAMYNFRINKFGINTSVNYKINTTSPDHYKFGNRVSINSIAYYRIRFAGMALSPNMGLLYEYSGTNQMNGTGIDQTGGLSVKCFWRY